MSEKRRHWFQIHLSTAVMLMFVAGGMFWFNSITKLELEMQGVDTICIVVRGFPSIACARYGNFAPNFESKDNKESQSQTTRELREDFRAFDVDYIDGNGWSFFPKERDWEYSAKGIAINFLVAIVVIFSCAVVLEWHIRLREARKP